MARTALKINAGWVEPEKDIKGLDHLGSAAPCIEIYSLLLPGITNVTNRARYFSLYPWILWRYEKSGEPLESERFRELLRRADCLLTIVAECHAADTDDPSVVHGAAMVGREKLVPAFHAMAGSTPLSLAKYSTRNEVPDRYFKNVLGGLGQYYLGTLEDHGVLAGRSGDFVRYDRALGNEIAQSVEAGVPGDEFWKIVVAGTVNKAQLRRLAAFCPCQLRSSVREHEWLVQLFLRLAGERDPAAVRRRRSLALLLDLCATTRWADWAPLAPHPFRDACYSGVRADGSRWTLPEDLEAARLEWAVYQRNDLLSVACQALLAGAVRVLEIASKPCWSASDIADALLSTSSMKPLASLKWRQYLRRRTGELSPVDQPQDPGHELVDIEELRQNIERSSKLPELGKQLLRALRVISALQIRGDPGQTPYGTVPFPDGWLAEYPVNLVAFSRAKDLWERLTVADVVRWIFRHWVCDAHLRVALRKLRFERRDTFRFYPTDHGFRPVGPPEVGYTNPRVGQAIQILIDLGGLAPKEHGRLEVTTLGRQWREALCPSA